MESWWAVSSAVIVGSLLVFGIIAATVFLDTSWPLLLFVLAAFAYVVVFTVRDVRSGAMEPVSAAQQTSHRLVIGFVFGAALIVIWLAR
jgi:dolichyl-phosphate-mannose--protein O-mannosyl transferase